MLVRNDDVAASTSLAEISRFCSLCDEYGFPVMHCVTLHGWMPTVDCNMTDAEIVERAVAFHFADNRAVIRYLRKRDDVIAVHGLYHTHQHLEQSVMQAVAELNRLEFDPTWFVPPFNEGHWPATFCGLRVSATCPRLEDYLTEGVPPKDCEIAYCHSWRFELGPWTWKQLQQCLARISTQHA